MLCMYLKEPTATSSRQVLQAETTRPRSQTMKWEKDPSHNACKKNKSDRKQVGR